MSEPSAQRAFLGIGYIDDGVAYCIGRAQRIADQVPDVSGTPTADALRLSKTKAPAYRLDTGEIAYEFEAWWVPEDQVDERIGALEQRPVALHAIRSAAKQGKSLAGS